MHRGKDKIMTNFVTTKQNEMEVKEIEGRPKSKNKVQLRIKTGWAYTKTFFKTKKYQFV